MFKPKINIELPVPFENHPFKLRAGIEQQELIAIPSEKRLDLKHRLQHQRINEKNST